MEAGSWGCLGRRSAGAAGFLEKWCWQETGGWSVEETRPRYASLLSRTAVDTSFPGLPVCHELCDVLFVCGCVWLSQWSEDILHVSCRCFTGKVTEWLTCLVPQLARDRAGIWIQSLDYLEQRKTWRPPGDFPGGSVANSALPVRRVLVPSLVRELDPCS